MQDKIDYIAQFINVRRFHLTDYEINKLVAFVDRRNTLNGKTKVSKGIEVRASSSDGRYDVREDNEYTYVYDASGVYLLRHRIVYHDGYLAYEDPEEEIRNAREILRMADWFLRE